MSLPTGALATYEAIGNREDLADVIYRIDPTETPFLSGVEKAKATFTNHEWQAQGLSTQSSTNAQLEGDDASPDTAVVTVRLGNRCQISRKVPQVSGTQQAVDHAGRGNEMAYQEMLKGLELKRDMETALIGVNQAKVTGSDSAVRRLAAVTAWVGHNSSCSTIGTSGSDPPESGSGNSAYTDGTGTRTDGTQRAFTESQLKSVLQSIWVAGGKPDVIMTGAFNKQAFSTFTGRSSPIEQAVTKKITAAVDAYESDFGVLKVIPNRFQRSREVWAFQMDLWAVAFLNGRRMVSVPLAQVGDSIRRMILSEYTLEARNERASGIVADLTTA